MSFSHTRCWIHSLVIFINPYATYLLQDFDVLLYSSFIWPGSAPKSKHLFCLFTTWVNIAGLTNMSLLSPVILKILKKGGVGGVGIFWGVQLCFNKFRQTIGNFIILFWRASVAFFFFFFLVFCFCFCFCFWGVISYDCLYIRTFHSFTIIF